MLDRIREALARALREGESSMRDSVETTALRVEHAVTASKRDLRDVAPTTRFWLTCLALALTLLVVALAVPALADVGSGYFLRMAVLLAGISLGALLDPRKNAR